LTERPGSRDGSIDTAATWLVVAIFTLVRNAK
jgi:hypothetical protein